MAISLGVARYWTYNGLNSVDGQPPFIRILVTVLIFARGMLAERSGSWAKG